jgi:Arc/MetJ family transcription regulator
LDDATGAAIPKAWISLHRIDTCNVSRYLSLAMPTILKLDEGMIAEVVKVGGFKTKQEAVNAALAEFLARRNKLRLLALAGKIEFDPAWDYKRMRRRGDYSSMEK